jgi:hypothetical protein
VRDERWRLVVVYTDGRREGEEAASYPLIGLDERAVCRAFGFKGSHVPSLPVPVHGDHLSMLQAYAATDVRLPKGTRAELWLDSDASSGRDIVPLAVFTALSVAAAIALWVLAGNQSGAFSLVLHLAAIALGLLAAWSAISTLLVLGVVRADRRLARRRK